MGIPGVIVNLSRQPLVQCPSCHCLKATPIHSAELAEAGRLNTARFPFGKMATKLASLLNAPVRKARFGKKNFSLTQKRLAFREQQGHTPIDKTFFLGTRVAAEKGSGCAICGISRPSRVLRWLRMAFV